MSRDTRPLGAACCLFFRRVGLGVVGLRLRALASFLSSGTDGSCLHHTRLEVLSPCTWRLQRNGRRVLYDLETDQSPHTVLRTGGCLRLMRPCGSGSGAGQHTGTGGTYRPMDRDRSRSTRPIQGTGLRAHGLCTLWRSRRTTRTKAEGSRQAPPRDVQCGAGRARRSLLPGEMSAYRTPEDVCAWHTPPEPVAGRERSTLCPVQVFSPIWSGIVGRPDGPAATARRLRKTPTSERHGPFGCRRSRSVSQRMPWHP